MNEKLDELCNATISLAQEALEESGAFPPFAVYLMADDELEFQTLEDEDQEIEDADQAIEILRARVRARLKEDPTIAGAALCTDVLLDGTPEDAEGQTDAICVHVELRDGDDCVDVLVPYTITDPEGEAEGEAQAEGADNDDEAVGEIDYAEPFAIEVERELFILAN